MRLKLNHENRFLNSFKISPKMVYTALLLFLLAFVIVILPSSFASLQPVKSVEIFSEKLNYQNNEPGAWKVTQSAKWTKKGEAEVTIDIDSIGKINNTPKDILLVVDISGGVESRIELIVYELGSFIQKFLINKNNNVGLITYNTTSEVVLDFTNNEENILNKLSELKVGGARSYYQALIGINNVIEKYKYENNKDCEVIFLTTGEPNVDSPSEIGEYINLKTKYPFLKMNIVRYNKGSLNDNYLYKISDSNYDVVDDNIESILYEISDSTIRFGKFQLTDYMNDKNFYIDTTEKIKASKGKVILDEINHSIKWEISNLYSGQKEHLSFKVKLQKESSSEEGTYPLITYADIDSVIDDKVEKINSNITPIIKDKYYVTYNENSPGVCKIEGVPNSESHFVFDNVPITESIPTCEGFQFKGWKVVTSDVEAVNNHYFTMPENDVELYGTWAKLDIKKFMSGTIGQKHTLYKQVQQDSNDPNKYVRKYEGDTSTFNGSEDVYYYYGAASNNNVIFANYCWIIVRTTDTGGVKLIYNGIPSTEGKCDNIKDNSQLTAEQMNLSTNKVAFNKQYQSPADVGYMYNNATRYTYNIKNMSSSGVLVVPTEILDPSEYNIISNESAQQFTYDGVTKKWISNNHDNSSTSLIRFSVNNAGTYYLNIEVSSEKKYDKAIISVDGEEKTQLSGNVTKSLELENLETSSVVEVKYTKDGVSSSGTDDVMFSIGKQGAGEITDTRWVYGNSFEYNETTKMYTLKDYKKISFLEESEKLDSRHYTCFDAVGECEKIAYIYYKDGSYNSAVYIELADGKSVEDALNEMLYNDDVNKDSSTIKTAIDYWYENNMTDYTKYLEDTVWCNNRTMSNQSSNGWNPNGGSISTHLYFFSSNDSSDLICQNKNDRFTVSSKNGNGALTYPVGLITKTELDITYALSQSPLGTGNDHWGLSPYYFYPYTANNYGVVLAGASSSSYVNREIGARPAVSLRPNIEYSSGDGSVDFPYVILTD